MGKRKANQQPSGNQATINKKRRRRSLSKLNKSDASQSTNNNNSNSGSANPHKKAKKANYGAKTEKVKKVLKPGAIFVVNLPPSMTAEEIAAHFSPPYGEHVRTVSSQVENYVNTGKAVVGFVTVEKANEVLQHPEKYATPIAGRKALLIRPHFIPDPAIANPGTPLATKESAKRKNRNRYEAAMDEREEAAASDGSDFESDGESDSANEFGDGSLASDSDPDDSDSSNPASDEAKKFRQLLRYGNSDSESFSDDGASDDGDSESDNELHVPGVDPENESEDENLLESYDSSSLSEIGSDASSSSGGEDDSELSDDESERNPKKAQQQKKPFQQQKPHFNNNNNNRKQQQKSFPPHQQQKKPGQFNGQSPKSLSANLPQIKSKKAVNPNATSNNKSFTGTANISINNASVKNSNNGGGQKPSKFASNNSAKIGFGKKEKVQKQFASSKK